MKDKIGKLVKEMIPIIFGILIALILNNWNENRIDKKYIRNILNSVENELVENKRDLITVIEEHERLIDTINIYQNKPELSVGAITSKANGIRGVSIKNTAWKSLLNANLELLDYETISILTDIDEAKADYKLKIEKLTDFLLEKLGSKKPEDLELFKLIVNDLLNIELDLKESHEKFILNKK